MTMLLLGLGLLVLSGLLALTTPHANRIGAWGGILGCGLGLISVLGVLIGGRAERLVLPWNVPFGSFSVELDTLSGFFLLAILLLSMLCAWYGMEYTKHDAPEKLGAHWFFFNLLVVSMALVVLARNGMLFLMAWEGMAVSSFFLVTHEDEKKSVQKAGWLYLVMSHLGTAFLLVFFAVLGHHAGSLDFNQIRAVHILPTTINGLFLAAIIGFGMKAGFMPLHIWLPEAHPAAPSHVSALMSGVMIKTGIYGLLRALLLLGHTEIWWGWLLIGIGLSSGILGVLLALAQHDLKRLLAYHSVENIGIITLGLGLGVLGMSIGSLPMAVLGFGGGLFHVLNHALFKGLLFLGSGVVLHATGTLEIERLGGLVKRMPWTAAGFFVGAVAISGLPPLNGFASELLIYVGAFQGLLSPGIPKNLVALAVILGLALIGGLATACFTKAYGIVFLGEPRTIQAQEAQEASLHLRIPMVALAVGCLLAALLALPIFRMLVPAIATLIGVPAHTITQQLAETVPPLQGLLAGSMLLVILFGALFLLRRALLAERSVEEGITWGCGYHAVSSRMQYTASSFALPLVSLFAPLLGSEQKEPTVEGLFPQRIHLATHPQDPFTRYLFKPLYSGMGRAIACLKWIQIGNLQVYILYIAITLLALLIWKLG